ncbi:MAG TPA: dihydropteroate synthase, partial [Planctomycetaceae bacterium]|nr:dihydropteroate synthase [Planctomycetaceae bacterium]
MTSSKITDAAKTWQLRSCQLNFENGPAIMGIVNVTPDSFSDGGEFFPVDRAVEHALRLEDAGAGILDIGGESTRPYSSPVSLDQELSRVVPVLERLSGRGAIPISIDTSKAAVAQAAIDLGAEKNNNITGLKDDPEIVAVEDKWQVGFCAMLIRGA